MDNDGESSRLTSSTCWSETQPSHLSLQPSTLLPLAPHFLVQRSGPRGSIRLIPAGLVYGRASCLVANSSSRLQSFHLVVGCSSRRAAQEMKGKRIAQGRRRIPGDNVDGRAHVPHVTPMSFLPPASHLSRQIILQRPRYSLLLATIRSPSH